jgi:hypothetical protein
MSSTVIDKPTANTPTSGRGSGVVSGAASGAAAGTMVMPGVGTVVGAVIGAAAGYLGGAEADKSQKHASLAYKYAKLRQERQAAVARRDIVRQFRVARAMSLTMIGNEEGGTRSSSPQGALAGTGAQFGFNLSFFDADTFLNTAYMKHSRKAGKHAATANMINATSSSVMSAVGSMGNSGMFAGKTAAPTTGGGAVSSTPHGSNTAYGGNWGTFAPPKAFGTGS